MVLANMAMIFYEFHIIFWTFFELLNAGFKRLLQKTDN